MKVQFNWQTALKIIAALVIAGFVWTQDNQLAVLTLVSMAVVWGAKTYAATTGKKIGKTWLTSGLLVVSVGLTLLFNPMAFPTFPPFGGDVPAYVGLLFVWLGALLALGQNIFALATGLYNILLAQVLDGLGDIVMVRLRLWGIGRFGAPQPKKRK